MAKGPYGNPLSTGIALNWEVDMTDYREDLKARKLEEAAKRKAQAKTKKAQADILKGITLDTSKVHERDRDQVSAMYAETIGDVMKLAETEQLGAIKVRQEKFERDVAPYITSLSSFNTYEGSDETKTYKDNQMARDWNDVDNITREEFFDKWGANVNLQKGAATFPVTNRIDLIGEINKRLQGVSKNVAYDSATGKPIQEGKLPTGSVIYKSEIDDPEGFIDGMTAWMLDQGMGAQYAVMGATGLKPEEFDEKTPTGTQKLAQYTRDYVADIAGPKLYGTKQERAAQPRVAYDFGFGKTGIGDVQFGATQASPVTSEYSTPEQRMNGIQNYYVEGISDVISKSLNQQDKDPENYFVDNLPKEIQDAMGKHGLRIDWDYDNNPNLISVVTDGGENVGKVDLKSGNAAQQIFEAIKSDAGDADLVDKAPDYEGMTTPEITQETHLTPIGDKFTAEIAGAKEPTATWSMKAGDVVYMVGDLTTKKVTLKNPLTLPDGKWQSATPYEDADGKDNVYYDIMFPVGYKEVNLAKWFGGKDELSSFKKDNDKNLPVSILIPENRSTLGTLESVLSTKEVRKALGSEDAKNFDLVREMKKYMNAQPSGSTTTNTPSFQ